MRPKPATPDGTSPERRVDKDRIVELSDRIRAVQAILRERAAAHARREAPSARRPRP